MNERPSLSLPEWTVLTVLSQQPAHGFAVAQLTASGGELGPIWQIPRPVIYRAIGRLVEAGLIRPESVEPGLGPQRTIYAATPQGRQAAERWLDTPVAHVRDIPVVVAAPFRSLDEIAAEANNSEYGLGAGIWTKDISKAHALALRPHAACRIPGPARRPRRSPGHSSLIDRFGTQAISGPTGCGAGWSKENAGRSGANG